MSKFEKYCWYYTSVNNRAFELMEKVPNFKVFRYEDLFNKKVRDKYFVEMLEYASTFEDGFSPAHNYRPELLDVKIHAAASKRLLPKWQNWNKNLVEAMDYHCGELMRRFGYGNEQQWQDKINRLGTIRYGA